MISMEDDYVKYISKIRTYQTNYYHYDMLSNETESE